MTAREVMTPAVTIPASSTIEEAARMMAERQLGGLLVVDPAGQAVGMLTQSDLLHRVAHPHLPPHLEILGSTVYLTTPGRMEELMGKIAGVLVKDAMSRDLVVAEPSMSVAEVADLMLERKVGRIPILQDGHPIGMVTREDLIRRVVAGIGGTPAN